jgi:hypothetical protein
VIFTPEHVASLLLKAAMRSRSFRPSAYLEIPAFALGSKPMLRFVLENPEDANFKEACEALSLGFSSKLIYLKSEGASWFSIVDYPTDKARALIVIGANQNSCDQLLEVETLDASYAGQMLGYPSCCVESFPLLAKHGGQWGHVLAKTADSCSNINALTNRYAAEWGGGSLIGELFPCSLECEHAKYYAINLYQSAINLGLIRLANWAKNDCLVPINLSNDGTVRPMRNSGKAMLSFIWKE